MLQCPYTADKARLVVKEMADQLALDLVGKGLVTDQVVLTAGYDIENLKSAEFRKNYHGEIKTDRYGRNIPKHAHGTAHLETVVLLSKLNTKQHIEVELNLDELDLTAAESKATYDEIKAYVLEKYGLKVSSLYISQVKRKCGLDVGQNYNLSKKEDAKVPQCPPEKEAAIMDALKHFQMIM